MILWTALHLGCGQNRLCQLGMGTAWIRAGCLQWKPAQPLVSPLIQGCLPLFWKPWVISSPMALSFSFSLETIPVVH